ncbi:hypothetical protein ACFRH4_08670 [Streptomyces mirabilis]|uniref:hypothetical protein n=1 Tax=Streptomyces mirabilis TaxID=68239 RepID=UPI003699DC94
MDEQYAEDYAAIEQDLTAAQTLEFGAYAGYLAQYGIRLRELAEKHEHPEAAYGRLLQYSDDFLDRLNQ